LHLVLSPYIALTISTISTDENQRIMLHVLRVVFRETMVIQMKNQSVDIKVLLHQNIQCINILAQAPDTQIVSSFV